MSTEKLPKTSRVFALGLPALFLSLCVLCLVLIFSREPEREAAEGVRDISPEVSVPPAPPALSFEDEKAETQEKTPTDAAEHDALDATGAEGVYGSLIRQAVREIDVNHFRILFEPLSAEDPDTREGAMRALKGEIGTDFGYGTVTTDMARERHIQIAKRYPDNLERALKEELAKISEMPNKAAHYERAMAVIFLGESAPHPAFVPLLRSILANPNEDEFTRIKAIVSLARTPHEGMVEYLIGQLETDLGYYAWELLWKLLDYGGPPGVDPRNRRDGPAIKRSYDEYWTKHKDEFIYRRAKVMKE